jgi:branched-chain amino acid transport system ATP-binding protein
MTLFQVEGLVKHFGAHRATDQVTLDVAAGEVHALIGPNGAGKSTLVNLIAGVYRPEQGRVLLDGCDITTLASHQRVAAGLARCFQITSIVRQATVRHNLLLAVQACSPGRLSPWVDPRHDPALQASAEALAERVGLAQALDRVAGVLPHGAQRQLDVALALAAAPKLLLLDEPMAGMGPAESERMTALIAALRKETAILLIEHDMKAVFQLADRISVLVEGRVLLTGQPDSIRGNPQVRAVYLGTESGA